MIVIIVFTIDNQYYRIYYKHIDAYVYTEFEVEVSKVAKNILWETLDSEIHVIRAQHTRGDTVCVFGLHTRVHGVTVSNVIA